MDGFQSARVGLKPDQGIEVAAKLDDTDALAAIDDLPTRRDIALDEQDSQTFI